ncbi:poly-gamma-glutamate synthesis protein (capsule biosynthesis protein) [Sedimentibacter acidaminivorans]|uniref:Poly-gamma-glutamate synthesis protein (Capsule biosynthesis protein) n=1 Tax=Sedimentibacter acidaminivorans TaxID=913099 RepID=A0ABS4G9B4_9FIRM|nr:CapA family protein [Sedimentibacter acidaminivorans]MBP1924259.1 poly-gamma-glutamate synthesis protein (capsule biosynthesis protein) [Sedimentibacter acidaminivorans]
MQLLIAGDLVPTQSNIDLFNKADTKSLLGDELHAIWNSVDMRIFNLEAPLTDKEAPIAKCGPNLIAPISTINGIKGLNPSLIALANNHILDQGNQGIKSTQDILNKQDIPFIGVGDNLTEASKSYIIQKDKLTIGIYACAENEFAIATKNTLGANPFDPLESLDHIQGLKEKCDYVLVIYHGGKEHYRYPSPYLQKVSRKIIEKGADLVVCQHSHCIGCYEEYKDATIVYGQGNFIFDHSDSEYWKTSVLLKIEITDKLNVKYIPFVKEGNVIRKADEKQEKKILEELKKRSEEMLQEVFIDNQYAKFAENNIEKYLRNFSGFGKWLSRIDRHIFKGKLLKNIYNKKKLLVMQNLIECEAHRELFLKGIKTRRNDL